MLSGCAGGSDRRAENAKVRSEVSAEIRRICALPGPDRQVEIDRVKREAGMAIVCPRK
jgi:hypothetical protein